MKLPRTDGWRGVMTAAWIAVSLAACSSSKDPKRSEFGPTYRERMSSLDKIIKNSDFSARSSFEKQMPKGMTDKEYKASSIVSKEAGGLKAFSGADTAHRTKEYSESGKKSRVEEKQAHVAQEQNKLASKLFRTPASHFDAKMNSAAGKTFRQSDEAFATRDNRAATVELEKNKKPVILEPEKPTYTEDEVKRLLNKN